MQSSQSTVVSYKLDARKKRNRDELTEAQGLIQKQEGKKENTPSPSRSRPANQLAEELVYLETKESV